MGPLQNNAIEFRNVNYVLSLLHAEQYLNLHMCVLVCLLMSVHLCVSCKTKRGREEDRNLYTEKTKGGLSWGKEGNRGRLHVGGQWGRGTPGNQI